MKDLRWIPCCAQGQGNIIDCRTTITYGVSEGANRKCAGAFDHHPRGFDVGILIMKLCEFAACGRAFKERRLLCSSSAAVLALMWNMLRASSTRTRAWFCGKHLRIMYVSILADIRAS